jgi:mycoredoxin
MSETSIILYGTTWCPQTARAKTVLTACGAQFVWCDIEQDKAGCAYVESVNRGKRSVPTILFPDGSVLVEPGEAQLEQKVRAMK